jgi:hypothetical protein
VASQIEFRRRRLLPVAILGVTVLAAAVAGTVQSPAQRPRGSEQVHLGRTLSVIIRTSTSPSLGSPGTSPATQAPSGAPVSTWTNMTNALNLNPSFVSCPSTTLCIFLGDTPTPANDGHYEWAISASTGPFRPGGRISGHLTRFPAISSGAAYLVCPSTTLCVLSGGSAVYATKDPLKGRWVRQVAGGFTAVSCPTVTFCAVATYGGDIFTSHDPAGGRAAWIRSPVTSKAGLLSIACPTAMFCVAAGGYEGVYGWIGVSKDPTGGLRAWTGGRTPGPKFAQGPNEWDTSASCLTTSFCIGLSQDLLVSSDPAAGPSTWKRILGNPMESPGVAWCQPGGECSVTGIGTFHTAGSSAAVSGNPWTAVSCITKEFCVSALNGRIQVGGVPVAQSL